MVRFAPRFAAAIVLGLLGTATAATAQEASSVSFRDAAAVAALAAPPADPFPPASSFRVSADRRPGALVPLYVSFAALQVLDTHSTSRALDRGGVEANPVMKGVAGNDVGMLAVKAGGTAGVIYATEKMWKKNRPAAVVFMIAANSAMAWVVQHNYQLR